MENADDVVGVADDIEDAHGTAALSADVEALQAIGYCGDKLLSSLPARQRTLCHSLSKG